MRNPTNTSLSSLAISGVFVALWLGIVLQLRGQADGGRVGPRATPHEIVWRGPLVVAYEGLRAIQLALVNRMQALGAYFGDLDIEIRWLSCLQLLG